MSDHPRAAAEHVITAFFVDLEPNTQFQVRWTASHKEDDPYPYVLGTNAYSNRVGTVKALAYLTDLASNYPGTDGDGPIYEVRACLLDVHGNPVQTNGFEQCCNAYVGYVPESMWSYGSEQAKK